VIHCDESLYLRFASGPMVSIVHQGDPAPGGGTFRGAFFPQMNNAGQIAFVATVTPAGGGPAQDGVYLYSDGTLTAVARAGDVMPGGGALVFIDARASLNDNGTVAFDGGLDSDTIGLGFDTGVYTWSDGSVHLVARTGTPIPGLGVMDEVDFPSVSLNNRGRIAFCITGETSTIGPTPALVIANA
jgi:hypothetical protein